MTELWAALFGRRHRVAPDGMRDQVWTCATRVTLARATLSAAMLGLAIVEQSQSLLLVGLGVSMALDVLDGHIARARKAETSLGAQLDGLADRLTAALVLAGIVGMDPTTAVAVAGAVVWVQYGVVEQLLNTQFLRFGLWSPDHFYLESEWVWRLNWSALAKMVSGLPIVLLACGMWQIASLISIVLIALRAPCYLRIAASARRLPERYPRNLAFEADAVAALVAGSGGDSMCVKAYDSALGGAPTPAGISSARAHSGEPSPEPDRMDIS